MCLALQGLLTIDQFDFVFIFFDENIFVSEQGVQFFLVVFCCRLLILQLIFVHLLVLLHFFSLLAKLIVELILQFPQLVLHFAAISAVGLELSSLIPYLDSKRVVLVFGAFQFVNQTVFFGFVLMYGAFELLVFSGKHMQLLFVACCVYFVGIEL
jgi:hypothetical protein